MRANEFPDRMVIQASRRVPENRDATRTLREYLTCGDRVKYKQAVDALTDFVRRFCREQRRVFVRHRPFHSRPVVVVDGHVPVYEADLDPARDVRNVLAERIEATTVQVKDEGEYRDLAAWVGPDLPEATLFRLRRIEQLAQKCVEHSSAFVSAWEFDSHEGAAGRLTDPEAWHKELGQLLGLRALDDHGTRIYLDAGAGI